MTPADTFHAHLDRCQQCRDAPFDLCATGAALLRATQDVSPTAAAEALAREVARDGRRPLDVMMDALARRRS